LFDPAFLVKAPGLVTATLAVVLVGKPLAALAIVLRLGYPFRVALSVAVALAQIGEFSFILASLGRQLGILSADATSALAAAALVSLTLTPLLYRLVAPVEAWATRRTRLAGWLKARERKPAPAGPKPAADWVPPRYRAVVVGYGPVGRTVTRLLREN